MKWLLLTLVAAMLQLILAEVFAWFPAGGRSLVRRAARLLPSSDRARYQEEWLAELEALPAKGLFAFLFGLRVLLRAPTTRRALGGQGIAPPLMKRGWDIGVSSVICLTLVPLFVLCAVGIRHAGRRGGLPILYRAEHVGRGGGSIYVLRFLTFSVGDRGKVQLTTFGRVLRHSSLDELPRLFNVLRGDLALVGLPPLRPGQPIPEDLRDLQRDTRPGMTSWTAIAQWKGLPIETALERDRQHLRHWTLRGELAVLANTMLAVLAPVHPTA